ncbi:hypothetical protein AB0C13_34185 [Streptomyces sp. NPDC049099]|uniref:hypothetical protein n=1 Tax=Streptomyces sp. NPDC049099 TaxID=3155768 RepID=UPI0034322C9E
MTHTQITSAVCHTCTAAGVHLVLNHEIHRHHTRVRDGRAQGRGEDGAGGDADGDCAFGPAGGAVVEDGQDVPMGAMDLYLLARAQCHGRGRRCSRGIR